MSGNLFTKETISNMISEKLRYNAIVLESTLLSLHRKCRGCSTKNHFNDIMSPDVKNCSTSKNRKSECQKSEIQSDGAAVDFIQVVQGDPR